MDFCTNSMYKIELKGDLLKEANECEDFDNFLDKLFDKLGIKEKNVYFITSETDTLNEETYDKW